MTFNTGQIPAKRKDAPPLSYSSLVARGTALRSCPHHCLIQLVGVEVLEQDASRRFQLHRHLQGPLLSKAWLIRNFRDVLRLRSPPTLGNFVSNLLAFVEALESATHYARVVHEDVFASIIWAYETVALLAVEPLDRSWGIFRSTPVLSPAVPALYQLRDGSPEGL